MESGAEQAKPMTFAEAEAARVTDSRPPNQPPQAVVDIAHLLWAGWEENAQDQEIRAQILEAAWRVYAGGFRRTPQDVDDCRNMKPERQILDLMADDSERSAVDIGNDLDMGAARIYPFLQLLEDKDLLSSRFVKGDYPRRRVYKITSDGLVVGASQRMGLPVRKFKDTFSAVEVLKKMFRFRS